MIRYDARIHGPIPGGKVFVDDILHEKVYYVSEEGGIVMAYETDENGSILTDPETGEPKTAGYMGKVRLECDPQEHKRIERINQLINREETP